MLVLKIDRCHPVPVYEQVANQLRRIVASSDLDPGTALPSVRQLAGDLGVNLNTIARAYRLLEEEGFLLIRDRAGVEVAAPAV
jgi:DNA-binding transcriptional regulator YhcF (GntR family)